MWERCDQPPETPWESCDGADVPDLDIRERQPEFATPTHELESASIERRPDAIALDYWTAHTLGPVREGDTSEGLLARVWRAHTPDGLAVFLSREREDRTGWEGAKELFTIENGGPPIVELDVAFTQAGQAVIVFERATGPGGSPEVWAYFYDATVPGYVVRRIGQGRTPRALLDRPLEVAESDVTVFYVADHVGRIAYRQQRDRYEVEILTPVEATENTFVEDVAKGSGRRLVVLLSDRQEDGTYRLRMLASTLFPFVVNGDSVGVSHSFPAVELVQEIIDAPPLALAHLGVSHAFSSVELRDIVIRYTMLPTGVGVAHAFSSIELQEVVVLYLGRPEAISVAHAFSSVAVEDEITLDVAAVPESVSASHAFTSVVLEAV